jgi:hypothetical protein
MVLSLKTWESRSPPGLQSSLTITSVKSHPKTPRTLHVRGVLTCTRTRAEIRDISSQRQVQRTKGGRWTRKPTTPAGRPALRERRPVRRHPPGARRGRQPGNGRVDGVSAVPGPAWQRTDPENSSPAWKAARRPAADDASGYASPPASQRKRERETQRMNRTDRKATRSMHESRGAPFCLVALAPCWMAALQRIGMKCPTSANPLGVPQRSSRILCLAMSSKLAICLVRSARGCLPRIVVSIRPARARGDPLLRQKLFARPFSNAGAAVQSFPRIARRATTRRRLRRPGASRPPHLPL